MNTINIEQLENLYRAHVREVKSCLDNRLYMIAFDFHSRAIAVGHILESLGRKPDSVILSNTISLASMKNDEYTKKLYEEFVGYVKDWGDDYKNTLSLLLELSQKTN